MLHMALVVRFPMLFCQYTFRMFQFPSVWKQIQKFFMSCILVIRHLGDYIIQVLPWVYIVCLAGSQQRTDDRHICRRPMVAAEEVILPSQGNRPDAVPGRIVVPKQVSVLQTFHHVLPSGIGIRDGFPGLGVGTVPDAFRFHPYFHGLHDRPGQFPTFRLAFVV